MCGRSDNLAQKSFMSFAAALNSFISLVPSSFHQWRTTGSHSQLTILSEPSSITALSRRPWRYPAGSERRIPEVLDQEERSVRRLVSVACEAAREEQIEGRERQRG